jgi:hypothetical protein
LLDGLPSLYVGEKIPKQRRDAFFALFGHRQSVPERFDASMSLSAFLDTTAVHRRGVPAKDAIGGTTISWPIQTASVPCAVWPKDSGIVRTFARMDIKGTHALVTATDLGAKATDKFVIGASEYLVNGVQPFSNAGVSGETVIVHDVTKRTV